MVMFKLTYVIVQIETSKVVYFPDDESEDIYIGQTRVNDRLMS